MYVDEVKNTNRIGGDIVMKKGIFIQINVCDKREGFNHRSRMN